MIQAKPHRPKMGHLTCIRMNLMLSNELSQRMQTPLAQKKHFWINTTRLKRSCAPAPVPDAGLSEGPRRHRWSASSDLSGVSRTLSQVTSTDSLLTREESLSVLQHYGSHPHLAQITFLNFSFGSGARDLPLTWGVRGFLLENKSRSERMRKGGRSLLTHWPTLRCVRSCWGAGGQRQLLWLCHQELAYLVKNLKDRADCCRVWSISLQWW